MADAEVKFKFDLQMQEVTNKLEALKKALADAGKQLAGAGGAPKGGGGGEPKQGGGGVDKQKERLLVMQELQKVMQGLQAAAVASSTAIQQMLDHLGSAGAKSGGVQALVAEFEKLKGLVDEVSAGLGNAGVVNVDQESITALQEALRLVGVQAQNAQHALAGMVSVEGYDPAKLGVLHELVGIYRDLAVEAREAAMYAEKFAQAAPALNKEGKDLEEKVKRLEEQIKGLQGVIAEREKEIEQLERSAERLDKHKKATEEDAAATEKERFAMELSVMTKQQLIAKIRELTKAQEEAAKAQDAEGYEHYTELLGVAKSKLRETNNELNLQKMAYLQQAQAVKQMSGTLEELGENVSTMSEAAEEGELDLVGMAEGAMEFYSQLQAGLGPMGWFMLALQQLQNVINTEIKLQKELNELEESRQAAINAEADAYKAVAMAMQEVQNEEQKQQSLATLKQAFVDINAELVTYNEQLALSQEVLDKQNAALQEEFKHRQSLRKLQLEAQLTDGKITREQYEREMLVLDEEAAVNSAEIANAAASKRAQDAQGRLTRTKGTFARVEKIRKRKEDVRGKYKVSEHVVSALQAEDEKLTKSLEDAKAKADALEEELNDMRRSLDIFATTGELFAGIADLGGILDADYKGERDRFFSTQYERVTRKLNAANEAYGAALNALTTFRAKRDKLLGKGMTYQTYLEGLEHITKELELAEKAVGEAQAELDAAQKEAAESAAAAAEAEENVRNVRKRARETREAREANLDARKRADEKKEAENRAASATKLKKRARNALQYDEAFLEEGDKGAQKGLQWLGKKGIGYAEDGEITAKTAQRVLEVAEDFKRTKSKADDDILRAFLSMVDTVKGGDKKLKQRFEKLKYEMGR